MWKETELRSVKVFLDPGFSGCDPLILRPFDDSAGFWEPDNLHEVGHVADEVVVHALLIQDEDAVNLVNKFYGSLKACEQ